MGSKNEEYKPSEMDVIAFEVIDVLKKYGCNHWDAEEVIQKTQSWLKSQKVQSSPTCLL